MESSSLQHGAEVAVAGRPAGSTTHGSGKDGEAARADLLGGWDLVVVVWMDEAGTTRRTESGSGTLVYLEDGTFSLHVNGTDRSTYLAAHGLFSQSRRGVIAHHVEGSTNRRWIGRSYWYRVAFSQYDLVLEADPPADLLRSVWER